MSPKLLNKSSKGKKATLSQSTNKISSNHNVKTQKVTINNEAISKSAASKTTLQVKGKLEPRNTKVEKNIKRLLALSKNTIKADDANKIVKSIHGAPANKKPLPKIEQQSIFTEEDFKAFEREYSIT